MQNVIEVKSFCMLQCIVPLIQTVNDRVYSNKKFYSLLKNISHKFIISPFFNVLQIRFVMSSPATQRQQWVLQSWTIVLGHWTFTGINLIHDAPSPPPPRSMLKIQLKKLLVHYSTFNIEWGREKGGFVTLFCIKSILFQVNNKNISKSHNVP